MERIQSAPEERAGSFEMAYAESLRSVSSEPSISREEDEEDASDLLSDSDAAADSDGEQLSVSTSSYSTRDEAWQEDRVQGGPPRLLGSLSHLERLRLLHLRRHVDQLERTVGEREEEVEQRREKLLHSRKHADTLVTQCQDLEQETREQKEAGNAASLGLLSLQLARTRAELAAERDMEYGLGEKVREAELELSEARLALGRFEEARSQLERDEDILREVKQQEAMQRLQSQTMMLVNAERNRMAQEKLRQTALLDRENKTQAAREKALRAQEDSREFLKQTLDRKRRKESEEVNKHMEHLEKRIEALTSLKSNIDSSRGTIQAQQLLLSEKEKRERVSERRERERILSEGGNPDMELLRRKKMAELERKREAFEQQQREGQVEIVSRLLEEEKVQRRAAKMEAKAHWHGRRQVPHPSTKELKKKKLKHFISKDSSGETLVNSAIRHEATIDNDTSLSGEEEKDGGGISAADIVATEETLAEPEIRGLWEGVSPRKKRTGVSVTEGEVAREEGEGEGGGKPLSKLERDMREAAMESLRKSAVVKQVAAGREFKGQAFISKPQEAVFQDFDLGKVYRKRLQLTNVSYTVNYCKLLGISECLKDFVSVDFSPPGALSAGLTCSMTITFQPKLDRDLEGEIQLLSQTGPFSIPIKCLTKKCVVSADVTEVDFGSVCVGEAVTRSITLSNAGALETQFCLASITASRQVSASKLGADGCLSSGVLSEQSVMSIMSDIRPREAGKLAVVEAAERTMSRSMVDLASLSQKSLTWRDQKEREKDDTQSVGDIQISVPQLEVRDGVSEDGEGGVATAKSEITLTVPPEPAITVGRGAEGELGAFGSCTVELVFSPESVALHRRQFSLTFSQPTVEPIVVSVSGEGVDVPVSVERREVDLKVCTLDRLYQDSVVVHNRAVTALRVTFLVPEPLQSHLEVLPKHGLVQGESSFTAQLKFMPRRSIFTDCHQFFQPDSNYLRASLEIQVAGQRRPVLFTTCAQVTVSDLEFSVPSIDFGSCTVHEMVVATVQLTNKSILPQIFGFVDLPAVVEVQPGDGFGTLLPLESLSLDVVFSARKPKEYQFELTCRTGTDRTFKLPCRGAGVLPPLQLSANAISFAPTVVGDTSTAVVTLRNPRLGRLDSAVIRGVALPQGPKAFEFLIPENSPVSVSPKVGVIRAGESADIQVQFSPQLDREAIQEEAKRLAAALSPAPARQEPDSKGEPQSSNGTPPEPQQPPPTHKKTRQQASRQSSRQASRQSSHKSSPPTTSKTSLASSSQTTPPSGEVSEGTVPTEGSDLWSQASLNLLMGLENSCQQYVLPCFVSSEAPPSQLECPAHRVEDTLYLELTVSTVRPGLVVISDSGKTSINFGQVGTGDKRSRAVTVKNISERVLELSSSLLDPHGPFELRNTLRELPPDASHTVLLQFSPPAGSKYYEPLRLHYGSGCHTPSSSSSLELRLLGQGVEPSVEMCPGGGALDMGHALTRDTVTRTLQLRNSSVLSVQYSIQLDSLSHSSSSSSSSSPCARFRTSNHSGQPSFNCVPFEGMIEPGQSCDITVTFSPDHPSPLYSELAHISLNSQFWQTVELRGQCWPSNMYLLGGDGATADRESMAAEIPPSDGQSPPPNPLLVVFLCRLIGEDVPEEKEGKKSAITRTLEVGCIKTPLVKKATGDFVIDPIVSSNPSAKAFTMEPMKSSVEAGGTKSVTLTFHPPKDKSVQTVEAVTNLSLKGDSVQVYRLLLRGLVCE